MRAALTALLPVLLLSSAEAVETHRLLPLGDGKIATVPRQGYVMSCQTRFSPNAPGADRTGDWIANGCWDPASKPAVPGAMSWPAATVSITVEGDHRVIRANNLPRTPTGVFPVQPGTLAYQFDRNPNRIGQQRIMLSLPATPRLAATPSCVPMGLIGFAVSGVAIYNALDARGRDAAAHEVLDSCHGHPEMTGQYHYHDWSPCLEGGNPEEPVGWMLDGFPILGPVDGTGHALTNADLDECHGRVGPVIIDGRRVTLYHYHFTAEYPYTTSCFRGVVDAALLNRAGGPPGGGPPSFFGGPPGGNRRGGGPPPFGGGPPPSGDGPPSP